MKPHRITSPAKIIVCAFFKAYLKPGAARSLIEFELGLIKELPVKDIPNLLDPKAQKLLN